MRKLLFYIFCGLFMMTQTILAQEVQWGNYAQNQAGLQIKLKETAAGSGILVILSTRNEEEPAWVPEKRKDCEMILSDASKLTGCKLIQSPRPKKLSYVSKDPNNISTASLSYIVDTESCKGAHKILINYSVDCKKGPGQKGQIEIPFSIKPPQETGEPIASNQKPDQVQPKDTTNQKAPQSRPKEKDPVENPLPKTASTDQESTSRVDPNPKAEDPDGVAGSNLHPQTTEASPAAVTNAISSQPETTPPPTKKKSFFPFYLLFILLVLGAIGWFIYTKNKKQPPPPVRRAPVSTARKQTPIGLKAMPRPHQSGKYTIIDLHNCWEDSSIHQVYLSQELMNEINDFVTDQNIRPFHEEGVDAVPEIGGFILGQYKRAAKADEWDIFLEKFAPITPGKSGVYRVSFEKMAWAELAEIQDKYPALQTLAWFHTHPGHGLFLSQPDLRIHNGFFKEKYQLAMEIDSLSEGLDTAFFSRKKSGEVNNRQDRTSNRWFKWEQLMKLQQ